MRDVEGEQTTRMNRGDANNNKGESVENCNPSAIQMLDAIQDKIDKRRDRKSLVRMFDQEGKKEITEDNIKNVLDALGFNYDEKHAKVIYHMANPSKNGAPPSTADIYKLLSNENLSKQFKDKTSFEDIKKEFDDNAYRKKKEGILTVITNDIKNIHKQLVDATEAGFVPPDKVKKILMNSAKSWEQADPKVIEEIVKEKTTSNGVDSQELLELIADKKLRMQMEVRVVIKSERSTEKEALSS